MSLAAAKQKAKAKSSETLEITPEEEELWAEKQAMLEKQRITATQILVNAIQHLDNRAITYDKEDGERSMARTVAVFNSLTNHNLTEEEGWMFMTILKMVRSQQGEFKADNYEDGAAYFALACETAAKKRK